MIRVVTSRKSYTIGVSHQPIAKQYNHIMTNACVLDFIGMQHCGAKWITSKFIEH